MRSDLPNLSNFNIGVFNWTKVVGQILMLLTSSLCL